MGYADEYEYEEEDEVGRPAASDPGPAEPSLLTCYCSRARARLGTAEAVLHGRRRRLAATLLPRRAALSPLELRRLARLARALLRLRLLALLLRRLRTRPLRQ